MALTRKFLIDLGIEKEQIQGILDEHGNTVELVKENAKDDAEKQSKKLNDKITNLQEKIDDMPNPDGEDYKQKWEDEVTAHGETKKTMKKTYDDYVAGAESEKTTATKRGKSRQWLIDKGYNSDVVDDFMLDKLDYAKMELDGDTVKGADEYFKPYQEQYAKYTGTVDIKGANVADPPKHKESSYTMEDIKKMSAAEINKNWDKIKPTLQKG